MEQSLESKYVSQFTLIENYVFTVENIYGNTDQPLNLYFTINYLAEVSRLLLFVVRHEGIISSNIVNLYQKSINPTRGSREEMRKALSTYTWWIDYCSFLLGISPPIPKIGNNIRYLQGELS